MDHQSGDTGSGLELQLVLWQREMSTHYSFKIDKRPKMWIYRLQHHQCKAKSLQVPFYQKYYDNLNIRCSVDSTPDSQKEDCMSSGFLSLLKDSKLHICHHPR